LDFQNWTREVAEELARRHLIIEDKLSADHWKVIEFVHDYYRDYCRGPSIVQIARATGFDSKKICQLFPCGTVKGAYRLAGLPKPPGCS
jgi:tRNA 2-thiouridine synthesizing protein E